MLYVVDVLELDGSAAEKFSLLRPADAQILLVSHTSTPGDDSSSMEPGSRHPCERRR
jgi:hypothetical protein